MSVPARQAVFLSYASQDAQPARRICEALRAAGVEVWFDQNELVGGDAWDQKIREQIKDCALFVPLISANTQARTEGYFRREWKLAVERTHDMADHVAFLLPVVIDGTTDREAHVPQKFREVQWTRIGTAHPFPAFVDRVKNLLGDRVGSLASPMNGQAVPGPRARAGETPTLPGSSARPRLVPLVIALVAAAGVGLAWFAFRQPPRVAPVPTMSSPPPAIVPAKSVAVLAFDNLSDDRSTEYFSDGISEELLNVLARVPGLKVPARTSAFHFKAKNTPIPEIARQLGVAYVVEGSVRKMGNQVRITAKLISASDGFQVWSSGNIDRELKDIFAVQDEIAGLIAGNLQLKLNNSNRAARTVNPEAYRRVLEGRHFLSPRTDEGFAQADAAFTEAARIDPQMAEAYSGVAEAMTLRAVYALMEGRGPVDREIVRAKDSAQKAIDLDPSLAEPWAALGFVTFVERNWGVSEAKFREALRLNPNYGIAHHWHGLLLGTIGRMDQALAALERAGQFDPLVHSGIFNLGSMLFAAGRHAEALSALDRAINVQSEPRFYHGFRAVILLELGRTEEALNVARQVRHSRTGGRRIWADGDAIYVLQRGGARQEAEEYLSEYRASLPADSHLVGFALCGLGRFEEGLKLLERMDAICQARLYYLPMMRPLHGTPEFERLFEKLNSVGEYRTARETLARLNRGAVPRK